MKLKKTTRRNFLGTLGVLSIAPFVAKLRTSDDPVIYEVTRDTTPNVWYMENRPFGSFNTRYGDIWVNHETNQTFLLTVDGWKPIGDIPESYIPLLEMS